MDLQFVWITEKSSTTNWCLNYTLYGQSKHNLLINWKLSDLALNWLSGIFSNITNKIVELQPVFARIQGPHELKTWHSAGKEERDEWVLDSKRSVRIVLVGISRRPPLTPFVIFEWRLLPLPQNPIFKSCKTQHPKSYSKFQCSFKIPFRLQFLFCFSFFLFSSPNYDLIYNWIALIIKSSPMKEQNKNSSRKI